jgi:protein DGCR14
MLIQARASPEQLVTVLEDDDFEAKMAAIIERDYFPDVKRLQNKLEWIRASESGDPEHMRTTQRNIVLRRAGYSVRPDI